MYYTAVVDWIRSESEMKTEGEPKREKNPSIDRRVEAIIHHILTIHILTCSSLQRTYSLRNV